MDQSQPARSPRDTARELADLASAVVRALADRRELSFTAAATLARLEREGPARLTALAVAEGVSQPSMTQLVQRLEAQGLVLRVGDPDDGRATLVGVTAAGRDVLAARREARDTRLAELLTTLPEEDRQALGTAIRTALPLVRRMLGDDAVPPRPLPGPHTTGSLR
ncbi:MarR family winged helix-turn-helix transcriptional regulator [Streptomyces sp. PsTaAH-124]|uniref:MarR family winged helix-turn-helix transcriptional regulator n=1 Tax=Streptomyces sp. PsTaAH-124 TaxID=1157638 RepID=UPI00035C5EE3|nr:MarR family transcriptional regulator [Streptomyces sp. PsTaAH-124]